MAPGIDTGPIAYESRFEVGPGATGLSLSAECARRGLELVSRLLVDAARGREGIPRAEQDLERRRYFGLGR